MSTQVTNCHPVTTLTNSGPSTTILTMAGVIIIIISFITDGYSSLPNNLTAITGKPNYIVYKVDS